MKELIKDVKAIQEGRQKARLLTQMSNVTEKKTKSGKPYYEATFSDSSGNINLKFWQDTQGFNICEANPIGGFFVLAGDFQRNDYGLDISNSEITPMKESEKEEFLQNGEEASKDFDYIMKIIDGMKVEQYKTLCKTFFSTGDISSRFRRSSAAVKMHHARRGGLLAHTSSMLRLAERLADHYEDVVPDLLFCGVIFHDIGKVIENDVGDGFAVQKHRSGELLGHITIGVEMVNRIWRDCVSENPELFQGKDILRDHLLHLIVSHHGTKEFGSPQTPRTPEAFLLHYIDNMDAHMEQVRDALEERASNQDGFIESSSMRTTLVSPLSWFLSST